MINAVTIVIVVDRIWLWMKTSWDIMGTCSWNWGEVVYFNISMYVFAVCILDVSLGVSPAPKVSRRSCWASPFLQEFQRDRRWASKCQMDASSQWSCHQEPTTGAIDWRNWELPFYKSLCFEMGTQCHFWHEFLRVPRWLFLCIFMHLQNWAPQGERKQRTTARDIWHIHTFSTSETGGSTNENSFLRKDVWFGFAPNGPDLGHS